MKKIKESRTNLIVLWAVDLLSDFSIETCNNWTFFSVQNKITWNMEPLLKKYGEGHPKSAQEARGPTVNFLPTESVAQCKNLRRDATQICRTRIFGYLGFSGVHSRSYLEVLGGLHYYRQWRFGEASSAGNRIWVRYILYISCFPDSTGKYTFVKKEINKDNFRNVRKDSAFLVIQRGEQL